MRQRSLVEQEITTRRNLEVQLEAKEQSLMGLRAQLDVRLLYPFSNTVNRFILQVNFYYRSITVTFTSVIPVKETNAIHSKERERDSV